MALKALAEILLWRVLALTLLVVPFERGCETQGVGWLF